MLWDYLIIVVDKRQYITINYDNGYFAKLRDNYNLLTLTTINRTFLSAQTPMNYDNFGRGSMDSKILLIPVLGTLPCYSSDSSQSDASRSSYV